MSSNTAMMSHDQRAMIPQMPCTEVRDPCSDAADQHTFNELQAAEKANALIEKGKAKILAAWAAASPLTSSAPLFKSKGRNPCMEATMNEAAVGGAAASSPFAGAVLVTPLQRVVPTTPCTPAKLDLSRVRLRGPDPLQQNDAWMKALKERRAMSLCSEATGPSRADLQRKHIVFVRENSLARRHKKAKYYDILSRFKATLRGDTD
jgi:hypothetical protein